MENEKRDVRTAWTFWAVGSAIYILLLLTWDYVLRAVW